MDCLPARTLRRDGRNGIVVCCALLGLWREPRQGEASRTRIARMTTRALQSDARILIDAQFHARTLMRALQTRVRAKSQPRRSVMDAGRIQGMAGVLIWTER